MEIFFQHITDADGLKKTCEELAKEPYLGFDTETTELDPYKGDLRLVQFSNGRDTRVIDLKPFAATGDIKDHPDLAPLRDLLTNPGPVKIAHNAKFDAKWTAHHLGVETANLYDTYLASLLISAGEQDRRHSLADVAQFFSGLELDKSEQVSDWSANELSHSQIEYAARDAQIMVDLRTKIDERLTNDGLSEAARLEFDCIVPIAVMELNGINLDEKRWRDQLEKVRGEQKSVAAELQEMLSAGVSQASLFGRAEINLDSQQQVTDALLNLGIPVPGTTRSEQIQPLAEKYPVIAKLLEYRRLAKSISSFGENILEFIEPATQRIHADFRQIGAPTGRFSCSNPNLQQIPHEEAYRRCFTAPAGKSLVIADYSQIELRILADFSDDKQFIAAFESGEDFHAVTAAQVFGVSKDEVTPDQRSFAKRLNFGVVYGLGASRFASMTGLSIADAENTLRKYFGTYRGLDAWLRETGKKVLNDRQVRTASGRLLRLKFDEADRQSVGSAQRYGKNMPIQGTSADILKIALRKLHDEIAGTSARLVNIVHDEIILECDSGDADNVAEILERSMTEAAKVYLEKVPVKIDVHTAQEWTK